MFKRFISKFVVMTMILTMCSVGIGYIEVAVKVPFTSDTVTVTLFQ